MSSVDQKKKDIHYDKCTDNIKNIKSLPKYHNLSDNSKQKRQNGKDRQK